MNKMLVKQDSKYYLSILSLVMLVFILVIYFYGPVFFHPNTYLFNNTGDAIKNYFTYEWHVQNDSSFINYTGSNYPYGENHLFTDGTPLLSNLIKVIPFLKPYSIGIFNYSMLVSLFVCAIILFKIFKLFNIENWKAVLSALGITVLCPQALRYAGHFSLSYGFCIPLIIYLLISYNKDESRKLRKSGFIALTCFLLFFIHPYMGMISSSFTFLYWIFKFVFDSKKIKAEFLYFIIQGIIPLLLYFTIVKLTDDHTDRNIKPYGFFYATSSIETIFISTHKPFRHVLSQLYKIKSQNGEGIAYIGISCLVVFLVSIFLFIKHRLLVLKKIKDNHKLKNISFMVLSAIVLLLFSMGFPFNIGMEWILDYVPTIQQFRCPGRFAWVFYFITTIGICIIICKYFFITLPHTIKNSIIFLLLSLFIIEGIPYHNEVSKNKYPINILNKTLLDNELLEIITIIKRNKPQAIIPLPFFHIGTDYYNVPGTEDIKNLSFITAFHSKVPLMANLTPRNSLTEAQKLIQITSNDLIERDIKKDIKSEAPFVILYNKDLLNETEEALLKKGKTMLETKNYIIKQISKKQLLDNSINAVISSFFLNKSKMIRLNNYYLTNDSYFQLNNYDQLSNKYFKGNVNERNILFEIPSNTLTKDVVYEISFWYRAKDKLDMNNQLTIEEKDENGNTLIIEQKNIYAMNNVTSNGTLASLTFIAKNTEKEIIISLNGKSDREKIFYLDDFMIREKNVNIFKLYYNNTYKDSVLNYNNIDLKLSKF